MLFEGLCGGSIYVNCYFLASERFSGRAKEFALGALAQSYGFAITAAGFVGLWYEGFVKELAVEHNSNN